MPLNLQKETMFEKSNLTAISVFKNYETFVLQSFLSVLLHFPPPLLFW